ncbi:Retrovirus-related Pol polyprotein from type-2 retrotransposable element R2DM [Nosema granulosis]|uniref:Retrovirus-related Pol polyprotein from type-2 retrotransposable element R2DM n=1 Tax=Nosema granulosis TaxID=83296 RepID=A0A9P6KYU2_9MICR|nr:Retrovirus-related Pol polyprotein from type-2 retrotransposable element R2DM [Nosema granulosis]
MLNKSHSHKLKTAWIDVKKAFDSVTHAYLLKCIDRLGMPHWISKFLKTIASKWNLEIRSNNETLLNKKVKRGILQGDSLSPLLFVLCMDPLSRRLNGTYPKVEVKIDDIHYTCNHLLFIDDLKLVSRTDDNLKSMVEETKSFLRTVGLEMNVEKSATNSPLCENDAKLLGSCEGYKYLGITESREGKNDERFFNRIVQSIDSRFEALCNTNLNAKNLIRAVIEFAISQINYYVDIIDIEPDQFKMVDSKIRRI